MKRIELQGRPVIGQVPLLIFSYLAFSFFVSGFIMTILAYAPTDSYLMQMVQDMKAMAFIGPIVLIIGLVMLIVAIFYCLLGYRGDNDDQEDYSYEEEV